jgi:diacylglycerol kinase
MIRLGQFLRSIKYAMKGFAEVFKEEQSFRIQIFASLVVVCLAVYFRVKIWEAITLVMLISAVLVLEILNSILERIVDALKPRIHPYVKIIKDMMASAVMLVSGAALIIGILIFGSHLISPS